MTTEADGGGPLIERLREAVRLGDGRRRSPSGSSASWRRSSRSEGLLLPERFRTPDPDHYARRLLYRDPRSSTSPPW